MNFVTLFLFLLLVLRLGTSDENAGTQKKKLKKKSTDWSKIDLNDLEKTWEQGDEAIELEHEYEVNKRIAEKRNRGSPGGGKGFDINDPESIKKYMKANKGVSSPQDGGPAMVFIELHAVQPSGDVWTKDARGYLASKWTTLMKTGAVDAEIFDIGDTSLLLNIKKGWMTMDAIKFCLQQPETLKATKDSKDIFAKDVLDEDDL